MPLTFHDNDSPKWAVFILERKNLWQTLVTMDHLHWRSFLMQKIINLRKENIMTEETNQTTTDQSAQSTQSAQPVQEKMVTIYASTNEVPFAAMLIPKEWANIGNTYPMTTIEPDPSLKSPKMDWNQMKWFENDNAQKGIDMENLKQEVDTLNGKGQESDTKIDQLLQISLQTNKVLGQLLTDKPTQSTTASTADKPTQSTTTSTEDKPTSSATTSTADKGGAK